MQVLHKLNKGTLEKFVFLNGNTLNLADLLTFPLFYNLINSWDQKTRAIMSTICRWFDYLQHYAGVKISAPIIPFELDLAPPAKKVPPKPVAAQDPKAESAPAAAPSPSAPAAEAKSANAASVTPTPGKQAKNPKEANPKAKGEAKDPKPKAAPAKAKKGAEKEEVNISKMDICVGKIV